MQSGGTSHIGGRRWESNRSNKVRKIRFLFLFWVFCVMAFVLMMWHSLRPSSPVAVTHIDALRPLRRPVLNRTDVPDPSTTSSPSARDGQPAAKHFYDLEFDERQRRIAAWKRARLERLRAAREAATQAPPQSSQGVATTTTTTLAPPPIPKVTELTTGAAVKSSTDIVFGVDAGTPPPTTQRHVKRPTPTSAPRPDPSSLPIVDRSNDFANDSAAQLGYRRSVIVQEINASFAAYRACAWGYDELKPLSCRGANWLDMGGYPAAASLGLTVVDSLTTLILANLTHHVDEALHFVEHDLNFDVDVSVSVFETIIRHLGALLSAYELLDEKHGFLLNKAKDLGDRLLPAFDTPTGLPHSHIHLANGNHSNAPWHSSTVLLSEIGSFMLEFRTLSYHTRDNRFAAAANRVNAFISNVCSEAGLCQTQFNTADNQWQGMELTLGGLADSYYEYLLKQYVHSGFQDLPNLSRFLRAAATIDEMLYVEEGQAAADRSINGTVRIDGAPGHAVRRGMLASSRNGERVLEMDHLACFASALFELGSHVTPWGSSSVYDAIATRVHLPTGLEQRLKEMAFGLGATCAFIPSITNVGLWPEVTEMASVEVNFDDGTFQVHHLAQPYLLRPEAFESFFYLHALERRGQPRAKSLWGDIAWTNFIRVSTHCRTRGGGYSGVSRVMDRNWADKVGDGAAGSLDDGSLDGSSVVLDDLMPSYWMAESFKYLLLTFSPATGIKDDESPAESEDRYALARQVAGGLTTKWVLNTEAHPLRIRPDLFDRIPPL